MTIRNRELSQFGSFIFIDNNTKDIGITTLSTPFVGIGTTNATSKFHVYGDTKLEGDVNLTGISTFDSNVFVGSAVSIYSSTGIISATEFKGAVTGDVDGNAGTATSLATARDFSITGDFVTATAVSFDGTGNVSLAATITADSIELGTYTSGDYVASISGTANQVSVDVTSGEGTTPTISLPNDVELPGNLKVTSGLTTVSSLTLQNVGIAVTAILDEDDLTSSRDDALATQQSIKAYVDNTLDLLNLDAQGDTGVVSIDLDTEILEIAGTTNEIETVGSGNSITIGLPNEVAITSSLTIGSGSTTTVLTGAGVSGDLTVSNNLNVTGFVSSTAYYQNGTLLVDVALQQWEDATLDSGTSIYRDFGNVGIGTSTNLYKLSVNGQIESQATAGTAPFVVQSQTTVENLSAKLLDGKSAPTGDIVGTSDSQTLTTKTINLSNNTLSGTTAQFNTALSDDDFATLNNSVTLTNKTLTSPAISTITDGGSGSQDIPAGIGTLVSTSSVGIITSGMIKDGEIVNADVSASAAIDYSKLNLSNSIVDGDITIGTIANDKLANSTISGISLGSNLADLTRGTDVLYSSGTTYNGGSAITISVDSSTAATANKIVKRDADGGITANDITAGVGYTFYGDGSGITGITADVAVKVSTADTSTAGPFYLTFVDSNNTPASYESLFTDGGISYDALTADLSVNGFVSATGGFNIGIQSAGVEQTTGVVTAINFIGLGNTFNYNAGTKTIDVSIESGSGGGDSLWESYATGISTTSNVGIGTTNVEAKLSIDVGAGITALDIQGSEGQLFSVTNNLTSGSIFSVNDVSGLPSIDVDADGTIELATYGGNVGIATTNPTSTLDVNGDVNITGIITATTFSGSGSSLTNIPNGALDNSTVSYGGVLLSLGGSDATPAFNLSDATNYPYTSLTGITTEIVGDTTPQLGGDLDLNGNDITGTGNINLTGVITATSFDGSLATTNLTGTITNAQLAGSIDNSKLSNSTVSYGGVQLSLGGSDATPAFDLSDATNYPYSSLTGITTDIVGDTSPQLGGNLDLNSNDITGTGNVNITGIVTATGGFNIGIQSAGVEQTTGVITAINFIGTGNTFAYNAGTKTIDVSIEGGGGGGGGATLDITASLFV